MKVMDVDSVVLDGHLKVIYCKTMILPIGWVMEMECGGNNKQEIESLNSAQFLYSSQFYKTKPEDNVDILGSRINYNWSF